MDFSWLQQEDELTSEALTVRAQTISPNDDGVLLWDAFFPRTDVDSIKLSEITTLDFRPAASRREWNQGGRRIPLKTPDIREIEITPVESFFKIGEQEIQRLAERTLGNESVFRDIVGSRIPDRSDGLVQANYRLIEVEAFEAWANGQITVKNPETGQTTTVSFGFDSSRYQTAGTDWATAANAYDEFISFMEDSIDKVGQVSGAVMRLATFQEIQADAPQPNNVVLTRRQVRERVQDELGTPFTFFILENTVDVFDDAGLATTRTKIWPTGKVAAVPQGEVVGSTAFAPVARAMELARQVPEAGIDIRGQTVYHNAENAAKALEVQAQVNPITIPDEQRVNVIDAGV